MLVALHFDRTNRTIKLILLTRLTREGEAAAS